MARIGNRTLPGRYTIGSWKDQEAKDTQQDLEQKVITTAQLRRGVEASLRGGAVASTVVPASLIDPSHWRELRVLWNPPR